MPDRAWRSRIIRGAAAMAALAIASATPSPAVAQVANPSGVVARPGETVRIRTTEWEYTGTFDRMVADTAIVRFAADSARVPRSSIIRTQVQRGTRSSPTRVMLGGAGGAVVGVFAGGFLGVMLECGTECEGSEFEGFAGGIAGSTLGLLTGAVVGGIWGSKKRYPRWIDAVLAP